MSNDFVTCMISLLSDFVYLHVRSSWSNSRARLIVSNIYPPISISRFILLGNLDNGYVRIKDTLIR